MIRNVILALLVIMALYILVAFIFPLWIYIEEYFI